MSGIREMCLDLNTNFLEIRSAGSYTKDCKGLSPIGMGCFWVSPARALIWVVSQSAQLGYWPGLFLSQPSKGIGLGCFWVSPARVLVLVVSESAQLRYWFWLFLLSQPSYGIGLGCFWVSPARILAWVVSSESAQLWYWPGLFLSQPRVLTLLFRLSQPS